MGAQAICHSGDLSTSCGQLELTQRLTRDLSRVDVLMQNAGMHAGVFINSSRGVEVGAIRRDKACPQAFADSFCGEVNPHGVQVLSVYLGRPATEMQGQIHRMESKPYQPENSVAAQDVASVSINGLNLPPAAEVTDIHIKTDDQDVTKRALAYGED